MRRRLKVTAIKRYSKSPVEALFEHQLNTGLPKFKFIREKLIIPGRKFRADFCYLGKKKVVVEIQGGVFQFRTGHNTGTGITRDCEKMALAVLEGYSYFTFTSQQVRDGFALSIIQQYFDKFIRKGSKKDGTSTKTESTTV